MAGNLPVVMAGDPEHNAASTPSRRNPKPTLTSLDPCTTRQCPIGVGAIDLIVVVLL